MEYSNPKLPPGLYTNGAFNLDTRQAATMLHQDQMMRQRNQVTQAQDLDKLMKGELGKVRSADIPDVVANYQKVKALSQAVLSDKKLHRDPVKFAQAQRDLQGAQNDFYTHTAASADQKARDAERDKVFMANPDRMDDSYSTLRSAANSLPLSKLNTYQQGGKPLDLSNDDSYFYKGTNTDFAKISKEAAGDDKQKFSLEEPLDKTGLQTKITPVMYGNAPDQMYQGLLGAFAKHGAGRDAAFAMDHLAPEEIKNTIDQYKAIPVDKMKKMGLNSLPDLTPSDADSKPAQYAKYLSMRHAIEDEPRLGNPQFRTNEGIKMKMDEEKDRRMAGVRQGYEQSNIQLRKRLGLDGAKEVDDSGGIDGFMKNQFEEAKKNPREYITADGNKSIQYSIPASSASKKMFSVKDPILDAKGNDTGKFIEKEPQELRYSADGKTVTPIFYEGDVQANQKVGVNKILSQPVSVNEVKLRYGKELFGTKGNSKATLIKTQNAPPKHIESLRNKYGY